MDCGEATENVCKKLSIFTGEQHRTRYLLPIEEQRLMIVLDDDRSPLRNMVCWQTVKTAWWTACRRAGLTVLRFHDLRHTFGTRAADAGVLLNAIRDVMGHKTTAMTERFAHATDEGKRRAVEAVQSAVSSIPAESDCHKFATIEVGEPIS